jgi:hypothetical protein
MMSSEQKTLVWSARFYRTMLRIYPSSFREEFEALMCQAFGDLSLHGLQRRGYAGLAMVWIRTLWDLISTGVSQRIGSHSDWRFPLRWITACTVGIPIGALLLYAVLRITGTILSWAMRVFVDHSHPIPSSGPSSAPVYSYWGDPIVSAVVIALFVSIPLAWLQSRTFGFNRKWRLSWILATIVGIPLGWGLMYELFFGHYLWTSIVAYQPFVHPAGYLLCGAMMGLLQTLPLALKTSRAWLWLPTSAVGMLVVNSFVATMSSRRGGLGLEILAGLLAGAIFGMVTALPLRWIVQPRSAVPERT